MALIQDPNNPKFLTQNAGQAGVTITPESLAAQNPIKLAVPETTGQFNAASLIPETTFKPTSQEQEISQQSTALTQFYDSLVGESADKAKANETFGVNAVESQLSDVDTQLSQLQKEALAVPYQQGAAGISGVVRASMNERELRRIATQALSLSAIRDGLAGKLTSAQAKADRAVASIYDPIRAQIEARTKNLELLKNDPLTSLQDKERASKQLAIEKAKDAQLALDKENTKEIYNIGLTALKYGADIATVQKIQQAKTPQEAIAIGGASLQDPMAKLEIDGAKLEIAYKQAQINKLRADTIREGVERTKAEQKEIDEQKKAADLAKSQLPGLGDRISAIDSILNSKLLKNAVGATMLERPYPAGRLGEYRDFISSVEQLTNSETLGALIDLKAQGTTLGALNQEELALLKSAATKIDSWKKTKDGKVVAYEVDEASFTRELNRLKGLTTRAIERAGGNIIDDDEREAIGALFKTQNQPTQYSPSSYFNP